jgi:hypothetical protein
VHLSVLPVRQKEAKMFSRRVLIPVALALTLLLQFLPGTAFAPRPVAAATPCDWAQFITDVSIPDGYNLAPGATFDKIWRLKNIGTCAWTTAYKAVFVSGSSMGSTTEVSVPASVAPVNPGGMWDITVHMTAPSAPGHYVGYWKLRNASGGLFGIGPYANGIYLVDINVTAAYTTAYDFVANCSAADWTSGATSGARALLCPGVDGEPMGYVLQSAAPQLEDGTLDTTPGLIVAPNQEFLGQNVPDGFIAGTYPAFTVQSGDRFQSIVSCAYGVPSCYVTFRLDYQIGDGPVTTLWSFRERTEGMFYRASVNLSSLAGQSVKFTLKVMASGSPVGDRVVWGGAKIVRATSGPVPPPPPPPTTCDRGAFVADVTIPDGTTLAAGTPFTKTWRIRNAGSCTWTTSYTLVFTFGDLLGASPVIPLPSSVAPGQTVDLSVNMVAPNTAGHYRSYWRFKNAVGAPFGVGSGIITFFADINVTSSYGAAYDFAANACSATWTSGAGTLPCHGTDGDARGFVLNLASPKLEDGSTGAAGLLTFPQNVTNGYIQGAYPALAVQSGDHFQSIINCQYGASGCYVTFQLNYQIGSGSVQTLKSFSEKLEGMYYNLDVNLSSLAGQNVKFILKVLAAGSPIGDRAVWSGPRIGRP